MATNIKNASPQVISLGTNDLSTRVVTPGPLEIPQHLPKSYIYAKKGPLVAMPVSGGAMLQMYDAASFDSNKKYYNHATRFLTAVSGTGNTTMVQRVIPADANPESNAVIYLEVVLDTIGNYARNSDGSYVTDANGDPVLDAVTPSIEGYRLALVTEYTTDPLYVFGTAVSKTGTLVGSLTDAAGVVTATASTMYPILELKAAYQGGAYNNVSIAIEKILNADIDAGLLDDVRTLPYNLSIMLRDEVGSKAVRLNSLYGAPSVPFSFKEKAINPTTETRFDFEQVFDTQWYNETNALLPLRYSDFNNFKVYRANLETVFTTLVTKEAPYVNDADVTWADGIVARSSTWFDFTQITDALAADAVAEGYLMDVFTGKSSNNVPYFATIMDTTIVAGANQVISTFGANTPIYMNGGTDGTLDNTNYEAAVVAEMAKYIDAESEVQDTAINIESVLYDSGFTLDTKKELCNFIGIRKDTIVVLSTHDDADGENSKSLADQRAIAVALKTRLKLTPESDYFGTGVARGVVIAGTGMMSDGSTKNRIPLTYSIAVKSAKMMGAGNGAWKAVELFDKAPGNKVSELVDVQPGFIPAGIKPTLWADGIVWAQPYDRETYHFPAIQTVYDNDTSVLNSIFTISAIATLNKISHSAWRNFTGSTKLSQSAFAEAVVTFVNLAIKDKFAGMYVVIPEVVFTGADEQRGYSWNLVTKIYGSNMKSVMVSTIESHRLSDLA